ncbi:MAG: TIGR02453 family protein, partial [Bacteroidales bacterium]|nr:TIGR02453 family protein [Bacteroidales bacterium]
MGNHIILNFLSELEKNNDKIWFQNHKEVYLKAKDYMEQLVDRIISRISEFDSSISDQQAKKCVFRIYRDVRFSKNKSPYKTNMGGFIVPGGKKSGRA